MAQLRFPQSDKNKPPHTLGERTVIGRSADHADLVIQDSRLSRKHCEIVKQGTSWLIRDPGSANGTRINGNPERITEQELKDGDQISLGGYVISFHAGGDETAEVPVEDQDNAILKVIRGTIRSTTVRLSNTPFVIGRKEGCDLELGADSQASQTHARIERTGSGGWQIIDLGSTNGTRVDGKPITTAELKEGSRISLGSQLFEFRFATEADDLADLGLSAESGDPRHAGPTEIVPSAKTVRKPADDAPAELDLAAASAEPDEEVAPAKVSTDGTGGGRRLVQILEIAVVVLILGAVGWFMSQLLQPNSSDGEAGPQFKGLPAGNGGLLAAHPTEGNGNASFEPDEAGGIGVPNWTTIQSSTYDSVSPLDDFGKGGRQVLRIRRDISSQEMVVVESQRFVTVSSGKGYQARVWARRGMESGGGSALLAMRWFAQRGDAAPILTDYRGFTPTGGEWQQVEADFTPPVGATAAKLSVGYAGGRGEVHYDEVNLEESEPMRRTVFNYDGSDGFRFSMLESGRFSIAGRGGVVLLDQGAIVFTSSDSRIELMHYNWLVNQPRLVTGGIDFEVFDPDRETVRTVSLRFEGAGFTLTAPPVSGSSLSQVAFRAQATPAYLPDGANAAVSRGGSLEQWGTSVSVTEAAEVTMANTGGQIGLTASSGYRQEFSTVEFPAKGGTTTVGFRLSPPSLRLRALTLSLRGEGEAPVREAERIGLGIEMAVGWPLDASVVEAGSEAAEGCATWWRIRARELATVVQSGAASTRDAARFIAAVDEADELAAELAEKLPEWRREVIPLRDVRSQPAYPANLKAMLARFDHALEVLGATQRELGLVQSRGREEAFRLRAERQRVSAEPVLKSAEDHYSQSELVQARLKYASLVRNYPNTLAASAARLRLLDIAENLIEERSRLLADGLKTIAEENAGKVRELLALVSESSNALSDQRVLDRLGSAVEPADLAEWRRREATIRDRLETMRTAVGGD